jgi:NAD(P)-dependent dehydrogenase (short-subunit alcohol dehydrogenase family)
MGGYRQRKLTMDLGLKNRIALVTGGSKGIGAQIVRALAKEGVRVMFCARPSQELNALAVEVRSTGGQCEAWPVDVFDPKAIVRLLQDITQLAGGLDILVNNVGGALRFGGFDELTDEDWSRAFEFNVLSVVRFTRAALPFLRQSELRRIINVSSISALQPGLYNPHYSTTKAAVVNLGKHLANVLAKERILVNTVCAGPVHSESWNQNVQRLADASGLSYEESWEKVERAEAAKVPLGVVGEGEQIATAVAFLASTQSSWTTGSCLHVSGGKLGVAL